MTSENRLLVFTQMLRIRTFEERVADAVEAGEIGTPCHLAIGQEAIPVGVCSALTPADTVWGGHRSHGHYLAKGGDLRAMMAEIFGRVDGCSQGRGGSMHLVSPQVGLLGTVPLVAATIPLAVGAALASKLREDGGVAVTFFGDGAVEEGHFHESMNLAALYKLPVIFVCENNFYSSHLGLLERRAKDNIVESAAAHGMPGFAIDGNDVEIVAEAAQTAVKRARGGGGPTFLECRTYRWRGHVGASWDIDVGVKRKDELGEWLARDPIARAKERLLESGILQEHIDQIGAEIATEVNDALEFARQSPFPEESTLLDHVYATATS